MLVRLVVIISVNLRNDESVSVNVLVVDNVGIVVNDETYYYPIL